MAEIDRTGSSGSRARATQETERRVRSEETFEEERRSRSASDDSVVTSTKPEVTRAEEAEALTGSLSRQIREAPEQAIEAQANLKGERVQDQLRS